MAESNTIQVWVLIFYLFASDLLIPSKCEPWKKICSTILLHPVPKGLAQSKVLKWVGNGASTFLFEVTYGQVHPLRKAFVLTCFFCLLAHNHYIINGLSGWFDLAVESLKPRDTVVLESLHLLNRVSLDYSCHDKFVC